MDPLAFSKSHFLKESASLLLSHGIDVNARDAFGRTPLHWAVNSTRPRLVKFLLDHGADPDCTDYRQLRPIARADGNIERHLISRMLPKNIDEGIDSITILSEKVSQKTLIDFCSAVLWNTQANADWLECVLEGSDILSVFP